MEDNFLIVPSGAADSYCRLCLSEVNVESLLVVSNGKTQPNQILSQLIKRYMEIDLSSSTATVNPCGICSTCRKMLEEFERFRERVVRCDYVLTGKSRNGTGAGGRQEWPFQCSECSSYKFQFKSDFEKHWKSFHDCPHQCDQCEARFSTESLLKYHRFRYHREGVVDDLTLSCSHCPRIFADNTQLQFHVRVLHGPVGVATAVVDLAEGEIEQPLAEVEPPPAKKGKSKSSEVQMENDSVDTNKKPFVCETCGAQFHFIGSLRHHLSNVHNKAGPKPKPRKNTAPIVPDKASQPQPAIVSAPPAVHEPAFGALVNSTNMTVVRMYDQDNTRIEQEIMPDLVPFAKMEQPEPMPYQQTEPFQYPGMYPFVIALERLDPNLIPPILNFEIPLGKIYYAQQQLAVEQHSTADQLDDELLMNYPTFAQKVSKQYICNICSKECSSYKLLTQHIQYVHEGIVYQCVECGKQFPSNVHLERHSYQHTNDFPNPCDECPLKFFQKRKLQLHKEKYHVPGAPPQTIDYCPFCNRAFNQISAFKHHVRFLHRDRNPETMQEG